MQTEFFPSPRIKTSRWISSVSIRVVALWKGAFHSRSQEFAPSRLWRTSGGQWACYTFYICYILQGAFSFYRTFPNYLRRTIMNGSCNAESQYDRKWWIGRDCTSTSSPSSSEAMTSTIKKVTWEGTCFLLTCSTRRVKFIGCLSSLWGVFQRE